MYKGKYMAYVCRVGFGFAQYQIFATLKFTWYHIQREMSRAHIPPLQTTTPIYKATILQPQLSSQPYYNPSWLSNHTTTTFDKATILQPQLIRQPYYNRS